MAKILALILSPFRIGVVECCGSIGIKCGKIMGFKRKMIGISHSACDKCLRMWANEAD